MSRTVTPARPESAMDLHDWSSDEKFTIAYDSINIVHKNKKTGVEKKLLSNVSGVVLPGKITAFMGPSGAGKTTILNTIAGRLNTSDPSITFSGRVTVDGKLLKDIHFKRISSYVMQDDAMVGAMTVKENIMFSANLRLPYVLSLEQKQKRVDETIAVLGLTKCQDTYVGTPFIRGVSGGERRRTSIAIEMVTRPSIIILDEPTSGLDSASSYHVLSYMQKLAVKFNVTVGMTIHQPSSELFECIDQLHLLAGGHTFYFGPRSTITDFFARLGYQCPPFSNPADFCLKIVNTDFMTDRDEAQRQVDSLVSAFESSPENAACKEAVQQANQLVADTKTQMDMSGREYHNGLLIQIKFLTQRAFLVGRRDIALYWVRVVMYMAMGILMGTVWLQVDHNQDTVQDRFSAYFFSVAFLCFMAVAGIPAFLEDRRIFLREQANGTYAPLAYVLSTLAISIPFVFVIALAFSAIAYPLMMLRTGGDQFFRFLLYIYLALLVAENLAVAISALIPFFIGALTITAFFNGFFMCVQGYFVRKTNIPDWWIWGHYLSYQKYSFEAMVKTGFSDYVFHCDGKAPNCICFFPSSTFNQTQVCKFTGRDVLEEFEYQDVDEGSWCGVLIAMIVVFRLVFWWAIQRKQAVN